MKKQMKIAAVVSAAALLAIGASFTSMAALKNGTWVMGDEGWQYVNKNGDYESGVWCYSNGTQYWVNDDGVLSSNEWVSTESGKYYVQSDGSMAVNAWKYLYAEGDEEELEAEEHWYYFGANGKMVTGKRAVGDNVYFFDSEGKMLTGWVDKVNFAEIDGNDVAAGNMVYCYEDGSMAKNAWINVFPWTEVAEDCEAGDAEEWYYLSYNSTKNVSSVSKNTNKKIDGLRYTFGADGKMLTGWVTVDNAGNYTATDKAFTAADIKAAYFCDEDYGYAKAGGWKKLAAPGSSTKYWYQFNSAGKLIIDNFEATGSNAVKELAGATMEFTNGGNYNVKVDTEYKVVERKVGSTAYYFNEYGQMLDGLVTIDGNLMYLDGGAAQTGVVMLTDEYAEEEFKFYFGTENSASKGYKKYVAVTGNVGGYLYNNGQLYTADLSDDYTEREVTSSIVLDENGNGVTAEFIVDENGKIYTNKKTLGNIDASKYTFTKSSPKSWNASSIADKGTEESK